MSLNDETPCVSDLVFDEWLAHELDSPTQHRLAAHVHDCVRCRLRKELFEREHAAFITRTPSWVRHVEYVQTRRARRVNVRAPGLWFAAAALAVLAVLTPLSLQHFAPRALGARSKGSPHLSVFIKRGERIIRGQSGAIVHPGDLLRFTYASERASYLALFNRDQHAARVYFPAGDVASHVNAGHDTPLDFSVELDGVIGPEHFYAVFCPTSFALGPLRAALDGTGALSVPDACTVDSLHLRKEPAP